MVPHPQKDFSGKCPTYANKWIIAFKTYFNYYTTHPLDCSIADYRTILKKIMTQTVAASARHVGASYADFMGIQISTIAEYLGHTGLSNVETYIHKDWKTTITFDGLLQKFDDIYGKPDQLLEISFHPGCVKGRC